MFRHLAGRHADDTGATLVIIVLSMLVLITFTALAIDMGVAYLDVRGSTNAADDAAMAAALQDCNADLSGMTPQAKAIEVAEANGYTDGVVVTESDGVWTVSINTESGGIFGRAASAAPDQIDVNTTSSAECEVTQFLDGYALFAGGPQCNNTVHVTGSSAVIEGGIHSNNTLHLQTALTVDGAITYISGSPPSGVGGTNTITQLANTIGYPEPAASLELSQFTSAVPYVANGNLRPVQTSGGYQYVNFGNANVNMNTIVNAGHGSGNRITTEAVYVTTGNFSFGPQDRPADGVRVTLIAGGTIGMRGGPWNGYWGRAGGEFGPGLLAYAGSNLAVGCNSTHVHSPGNSFEWSGVIFAPNGEVSVPGSSAQSARGSVLAWKIHIPGAGAGISYDDGPNAEPSYRLHLLGANG